MDFDAPAFSELHHEIIQTHPVIWCLCQNLNDVDTLLTALQNLAGLAERCCSALAFIISALVGELIKLTPEPRITRGDYADHVQRELSRVRIAWEIWRVRRTVLRGHASYSVCRASQVRHVGE
jgi:hypothetical protein